MTFPDPLPDPVHARAAMRLKPPGHPHPGRAAASPWPVPRGRLAWLTGVFSTLLLSASTLFWCLLLFPWPC